MSDYRVADVMTRQVIYLPAETTLDEAARVMKEADIGDVVVTEGATLAGLLTDRDIVVRAVAANSDPTTTTIGSITTREVVMIEQNCSAGDAAALMRERGYAGCWSAMSNASWSASSPSATWRCSSTPSPP